MISVCLVIGHKLSASIRRQILLRSRQMESVIAGPLVVVKFEWEMIHEFLRKW